jgi:catechol 2,3-dioxygenase-like lactoylglutathione lyase family enzyme
MKVTRLLPTISTDRMEETRDFYVDLLGLAAPCTPAGPGGFHIEPDRLAPGCGAGEVPLMAHAIQLCALVLR